MWPISRQLSNLALRNGLSTKVPGHYVVSRWKGTNQIGPERCIHWRRPGPGLFRGIVPKVLDKVFNPFASPDMPETRSEGDLVWIDCEMTGLDHENDTILSLACFITDANLDMVDEKGFTAVVHHEWPALSQMGEWCVKQHGASGLTQAALDSTTTAEQAAAGLLEYIQTYVPEPRTALLAGNSVHTDKAFLQRGPYKPVMDHLHYRILDVSAIKEAARRWAPEEVLRNVPRSKGLHEARADILESIEEARYYRKALFLREP